MHVTDPRQQRLVFCGIAFASFMVNVDTYIVNISLPTIATAFHAGTRQIAWVVLSYQLAVTSLLLVFGKLGDRFGLKRIFLLGFGVFTLSSLLCGLAPTIFWLVIGRWFQGLGASMLYALTPAMIPRFLPVEQRGPAFGALATVTALGITVGAPLGGLITGVASWHWIFLINIPVGLAAIEVCRRVIPDDRPDPATRPATAFDLPGAALSLAATSALIYGLSAGREAGWTSPTIVGCFLVATAMLWAFLRRQRRAPHPLLDLSLFQDRAFTYGNLAGGVAYAFLAGTNFLMPFYLMIVQGLTPFRAGLTFMIYSLVYMAVGPLTGKLSATISSRRLCTIGMGLGLIASVTFALSLHATSRLPAILYFIGQALAYGMFCTANNTVVMGMAPEGKQGIVSGVFRMVMRLGLALGVCVFELIFALALPANTGHGASAFSAWPREALVHGFEYAYWAGAAACLLALVFSALARPAPGAPGQHRHGSPKRRSNGM